jgi:hypothetical protein
MGFLHGTLTQPPISRPPVSVFTPAAKRLLPVLDIRVQIGVEEILNLGIVGSHSKGLQHLQKGLVQMIGNIVIVDKDLSGVTTEIKDITRVKDTIVQVALAEDNPLP